MTLQETRTYWAGKVAEYKKSQMSVRAWCRREGIDPSRIWYWLRKERLASSGSKATSHKTLNNHETSLSTKSTPGVDRQWIALDLSYDAASESGSVTLRMGSVMVDIKPGFDPDHLCKVVRALKCTF